MKKPLTKIFENPENVSREELQNYLSGKLQGEELVRVEQYLAAHPLNEEALEGLEQDPEALSVLPLSPAFLQTPKAGTSLRYKNLFWAAASVAVISSVILVYMLFQQNTVSKEKNTVAIAKEDKTVNEVVNEEQELQEIEDSEPIAKQEQITYKKTVENQAETVIALPEEKVVVEVVNPELVEPKKPELIEEKVNTDKVAKSNVKFIYLHDLKVIDYSGLYTSGIKKTTQFVQSGTPANLIDKNSKNELEPEIKITYVPYEKYLEETLLSFTKNDFKTALKNFRIIHQHYPEDLNAYFYGGLCYFNIGMYDKAISYFDKCIFHSFSTFEEEANWYKALSLIKNKKKEQAIKILQEIVNQNGFYAQKAQSKLKELK